MSTVTLTAPSSRSITTRPASARVTPPRPAPTGPAPTRPGRRSGRGHGPIGRPSTGSPAPQLRGGATLVPTGCALPKAPARPGSARWRSAAGVRLTERGIALILIAGVLVTVAALTVVGATAARVTSDRYQVVAVDTQ